MDYYRQNPALKVLGVTATPDRADEAALGQVYESVAFDYEISDAIGDGWVFGTTISGSNGSIGWRGCRCAGGFGSGRRRGSASRWSSRRG